MSKVKLSTILVILMLLTQPCLLFAQETPVGGETSPLSGGTYSGLEETTYYDPEAWDIITDSNVIVAVIDSGVDYTKTLSSRVNAVLGFTPQAFDQAINSVISTRLLAVSQL